MLRIKIRYPWLIIVCRNGLTDDCAVSSMQLQNNRSDIRWGSGGRHGGSWTIREDFRKRFHLHYPKWLLFQQDMVYGRRSCTLLEKENVRCPVGSLLGPHSGSGIPRSHWRETRLTTIFSGSQYIWLILAGLVKNNVYRNNPKTLAKLKTSNK